jgi:hypothetical protein
MGRSRDEARDTKPQAAAHNDGYGEQTSWEVVMVVEDDASGHN